MSTSGGGVRRNRVLAVVAVLTIGTALLLGELGAGTAETVVLILGLFVLLPLIALLGDALPMIESSTPTGADEVSDAADDTSDNPVDELRRRYASGEIDEQAFSANSSFTSTIATNGSESASRMSIISIIIRDIVSILKNSPLLAKTYPSSITSNDISQSCFSRYSDRLVVEQCTVRYRC